MQLMLDAGRSGCTCFLCPFVFAVCAQSLCVGVPVPACMRACMHSQIYVHTYTHTCTHTDEPAGLRAREAGSGGRSAPLGSCSVDPCVDPSSLVNSACTQQLRRVCCAPMLLCQFSLQTAPGLRQQQNSSLLLLHRCFSAASHETILQDIVCKI
jgi:hypothetical protein